MAAARLERYPFPSGRAHRATKPFRYISQTVMTRAERPVVDSWVHLAPTLRPPLLGLLFFVLATLGAAYACVFAALQLFEVIPIVSASTSNGGLALGMVAMALIACGTGWVASLMIGRWLRASSYGRRPSGVALGESGVIVRVPGRDAEIPWTGIASITPEVVTMRRQPLPLIRLTLTPDQPERVQMLTAEGYAVPTDALYTALRWYHARPDARWELGRVEGERRIEGWRQAALAMR